MTEAKLVPPTTVAPSPPGADSDGIDEARCALSAALDKKALEPTLLDVRGLCSYTNYILTVSGRSDRQVDAIAEGVMTDLRKLDLKPYGVEGRGSGQWVLLDYGDTVIHVFLHPVREHYDLEGLWIDAVRVPIDVPDDARISADDVY
ncbi:MAG: ribosome silencing factor [Myxococcota bacterium]